MLWGGLAPPASSGSCSTRKGGAAAVARFATSSTTAEGSGPREMVDNSMTTRSATEAVAASAPVAFASSGQICDGGPSGGCLDPRRWLPLAVLASEDQPWPSSTLAAVASPAPLQRSP
jgi:hypothetical protein